MAKLFMENVLLKVVLKVSRSVDDLVFQEQFFVRHEKMPFVRCKISLKLILKLP